MLTEVDAIPTMMNWKVRFMVQYHNKMANMV